MRISHTDNEGITISIHIDDEIEAKYVNNGFPFHKHAIKLICLASGVNDPEELVPGDITLSD